MSRVARIVVPGPLDDAHLWAAVRYVNRNPIKAGLVARAEDYRWSNAAAQCGLRYDDLVSAELPPTGVVKDWLLGLAQPEEEELVERIRKETNTGRPCGDVAFLDQIEVQLNRSVRPQRRGRKPEPIPPSDTSPDNSKGEIVAHKIIFHSLSRIYLSRIYFELAPFEVLVFELVPED
jgi:hypothetical protein